MNQPSLFPADQLAPQPCPVPACGAIRLPNQHGFVPTCAHDLNREPNKRPAKCLNHYRNRPEDEIPY